MNKIDPYWPVIVAWIGSIIAAFFGGIWVHGLTMRREAENRRREFRGTIRAFATQIESANWMMIYQIYQASVPTLKEDCAKILDDIRFWRRGGFVRFRNIYCSFKQSDIVPPPPSPAATREELTARKQKHEDAKRLLCSTLERIVGYAK